jgi:hypothetical protein
MVAMRVVAAYEVSHLILRHDLELRRTPLPSLNRRVEMEHEADVKAVEVLRTGLGLGEMQAYANMMLYYGFMVRALRNDPALAKVTPFGHDDPCEKMFYLVRQFPRYGQWRPGQ